MKELVQIGMFVIIIGFIIVIIGLLSQPHSKTETKFFGGGIIGFIPFGFGNDKRIFYVGLAITVALFVFFVVSNFLLRK